MDKEIFDISNSDRISSITNKNNKKGLSTIKNIENKTNATINIIEDGPKTFLKISGYPLQRAEAKVLMRDFLEKTSFIPTISYFILNKTRFKMSDKLQFVKFDNNKNGSNDESSKQYYFVEFLNNNNNNNDNNNNGIDEIIYELDELLLITPYQFNTLNNLMDCLERVSLKVKTNFKKNFVTSLFSEKVVLEPKIFIGKALFSQIISPDIPFTIKEWYNFNVLSSTGRRSSVISDDSESHDGRKVNTEFSVQFYDNFESLLLKSGFSIDDSNQIIQGKNKGEISIDYTPGSHKKRRLKLQWCEISNIWKIINHSHGLNRIANIDIISGSKAPDFRISLKTHYDVPSEGSKVEDVINKIQYSPTFTERDGMWFRFNDFTNTIIDNPLIRQVIEKKCFRNGDFLVTFSTVNQDCKGTVTTQKLIILRHDSWTKEINLDNTEEFMNSIVETAYFCQEMMNQL